MIFKVITHQGLIYQDRIDYVTINDHAGSFSILENHIPIIHSVDEGFLKVVQGNIQQYIVLEQALIEFKKNILTVLALDAQIGKTIAEAKQLHDELKKEKQEASKKETVDYTEKERELRDTIKKGRAGQV